MIAAGALDRRLTLLAAGPGKNLQGVVTDELGQVVSDSLGQQTATYVAIGTLYAQRLAIRTQDAARAGGRDTYSQARYLIRWRDNISTAMRVQADGKLYDILAIEEPDRRESLVLTCEEVTR